MNAVLQSIPIETIQAPVISTVSARCPRGWNLFYNIGVFYSLMQQSNDPQYSEKFDRAVALHRYHYDTCLECIERRKMVTGALMAQAARPASEWQPAGEGGVPGAPAEPQSFQHG